MRRSLFAPLAVACVLVAASAGSVTYAATPPSGSISADRPTIGWTGPVQTSHAVGTGCLPRPGAYCDEFALTVDNPPTPVRVQISWSNPYDLFEIYVFDKDGGMVASDGFDATTDVGTTRATALVPEASAARSPYKVQVKYYAVNASSYAGKASLVLRDDPAREVLFDPSTRLVFGPASLVSAHFLGAEPQMTMEKTVPGARPEATNPDRIFVDHPLSTRAQIGQMHRSLDGGDSFRLLFDPVCAPRSRPTCHTGGGGDSANDVNLFNGNVLFSDQQGLVAQEAVASSTDHGDTFPTSRQWAVTNATTLSDRQWLSATDDGSVAVAGRKIHGFLSYARISSGIFVQGIDQDGLPIPQEVAQIGTAVGVPGKIEVDTNPRSPGHNWIYVAYPAGPLATRTLPGGIHVATAPAADYRDRSAWISNKVTDAFPEIFVWLAIDRAGNAYATWVEQSRVLYSYSRITDRLNDPRVGGRPGTKWSPPVTVSLPSLGSTIFPTITAGDAGRIAIGYYGTEDFTGLSGEAGSDTDWHAYVAVIEDATAEQSLPTVHTGKASDRVVHRGPITGNAGRDRSLLDLIDIDHDQDGRVGLVFSDNHSTFGRQRDAEGDSTKPFTHFVKQVRGPTLLATPDDTSVAPSSRDSDPEGDSTWLNAASGRYLRALDLLGASLTLEGDQVVARLPVKALAEADVGRDLETFNAASGTGLPADRLKFVMRFATPSEIFHMSAEIQRDGTKHFYGGRLDENDQVAHAGTVVMASYRSDAFYRVVGGIEGSTVVLRGSAASFGLKPGDRLFGATAFAMAGPDQSVENLFHPMRTVDATPAFDATLGTTPTPEPTPTRDPTPTPDPTPSPDPNNRCEITGTPGNDHLRGTRRSDTICGLGGHDVLVGRGGDDILVGGRDNDKLYGGRGDDSLRGGRGRDRCRGGSGRNRLKNCETR